MKSPAAALLGLLCAVACRTSSSTPVASVTPKQAERPTLAPNTFMTNGNLPGGPMWQERTCSFPSDWEGPAPGSTVMFFAATPAEIRTLFPGLRPPDEPEAPALSGDEELKRFKGATDARLRVARIAIASIDGLEVSVMPPPPGEKIQEAPPRVALVGFERAVVREMPQATTARLAREKNFDAFGRAWARTLLEHSRTPPQLAPEEMAALRDQMRSALGRDVQPEDIRWTPPDPDAFRESAWIGVACELTQLARFAEKTGRRIYLEEDAERER